MSWSHCCGAESTQSCEGSRKGCEQSRRVRVGSEVTGCVCPGGASWAAGGCLNSESFPRLSHRGLYSPFCIIPASVKDGPGHCRRERSSSLSDPPPFYAVLIDFSPEWQSTKLQFRLLLFMSLSAMQTEDKAHSENIYLRKHAGHSDWTQERIS